MRWIFAVVLAVASSLVAQAVEPHDVVVELFVRNDSDVCRRAVATAETFARERAGLRLVVSDVTTDEAALRRYWQRVRQTQIAQPVMPGLDCGGRFTVGFVDEAAARAELAERLTICIFAREGCPHCRDAKRFLAGLLERRPALRLETFDVVRDADAMRRMNELAQAHGKRVTGLPVIQAGGQLFLGYQTDAISGRRIEALFEAAPPPAKTGEIRRPVESWGWARAMTSNRNATVDTLAWTSVLWPSFAWTAVQATAAPSGDASPLPPDEAVLPPPAPDDLRISPEPEPSGAAPSEEIELPYFGSVRLSDWGLPLFTVIIGLVDGFNPCAMWVLVFLLSVLVNVRDRVRIFAIAGTFVLISGLAYFAFMAAWLNLFLLLGVLRPMQIALGMLALVIGVINVKDFFAFKRGVSLSIPESAKPDIYDRVRRIVSARSLTVAVSASVVLAVIVNTVELLCTAGLPALYGEILTLQKLPWWQNYAYLGLYITAYMFDDALLLAGFLITLSHRKLQEREGRWLKLISGLVILLLGAVMIAKPEWLHLSD